MTTSADYPDDGPGRITQALTTIGHYANRYSTAMGMLSLFCLIMFSWLPVHSAAGDTIRNILLAVTTLGFIIAVIRFTHHDLRLCPLDYDDAPLNDPQNEVDQHMSKLRRYHSGLTYQIRIGGEALGLLIWLACGGPSHHTHIALRIAGSTALILGTAVTLHTLRIANIHARLHLWCPWCRHRRGDDDITLTPTPDPVGTAPKTV